MRHTNVIHERNAVFSTADFNDKSPLDAIVHQINIHDSEAELQLQFRNSDTKFSVLTNLIDPVKLKREFDLAKKYRKNLWVQFKGVMTWQ